MGSTQNGGITATKIQNLKKDLNALEAGVNGSNISQAEMELKKSLQEQLWTAAITYESMMRQKSRVKWIREGDTNSAYFHRLINHRRRVNAFQGGLNGMMRKAKEENMYKAYQVGSNKVEISLLQFADDTIFLGEADMENVKTIKAVLRSFELASDLKINFAKSIFGAFGQTDLWKQQAATYLNCQLLVLPFNYLGIPIGANPRRCTMWDPIIHKCERKLAKMPKSVEDKLVRLQRRFLWGGGPDQNKIAWVSWKSVCLPKEKGSLGLKDIKSFNTALLGKWEWNLMHHKGELWAKVLDSKYGGWRGLAEVDRVGHKCIWWRDLQKVLFSINSGQLIQKGLKWKVGSGDHIKFWEDKWTGEEDSLA
ncbi:putative ribonuclease H protein [Glycine max]|nr:putative ribonuclease H protein [Glycine max]